MDHKRQQKYSSKTQQAKATSIEDDDVKMEQRESGHKSRNANILQQLKRRERDSPLDTPERVQLCLSQTVRQLSLF